MATTKMTLEQVLARVEELKPFVAKQGGGGGSMRAKNREYTDLLWYAHNDLGLTVYRVAKLIGADYGCVRARLVRYGYKQGCPSIKRSITISSAT